MATRAAPRASTCPLADRSLQPEQRPGRGGRLDGAGLDARPRWPPNSSAWRPVPGRLQLVGDLAQRRQPLAVVDYAHTPDALANALQALRPLARQPRWQALVRVRRRWQSRCRQARSRWPRRPKRHADLLVLTSDNPRNEAPDAILAQLRDGLSAAPHLVQSGSRPSDRRGVAGCRCCRRGADCRQGARVATRRSPAAACRFPMSSRPALPSRHGQRAPTRGPAVPGRPTMFELAPGLRLVA